MKFIYPEFLWAFGLLAIPIVIHLFNFKRYKTLYFSSLSFIKQVDEKTKSTQQLKHLLILISRILAFSFLILAFAQPYFSSDQEETNNTYNVMVMYIDNSFSMQALGPEGELLSQAKENARKIIEDASLDTRFIIGTNEMSGVEERILSKIEAFEKIDEIEFSPLVRETGRIINWQTGILEANDIAVGSTKYILLSDFQESNCVSPINSNKSSPLFYPVQLSPELSENILIDSVWFSSPIHKPLTNNELNIRVVNKGTEEIENAEILVNLGEYKKTIFVNLPPNQPSITRLTYTDKTTGIKQGSVQVVDRNVFFDDVFYLNYEVRDEINILLLNGEDAVNNIELVYNLDDFYKIESKAITSITKDDFNNKDLVVINGENSMPRGISNYLVDFENTGGSVALFPGTSPNRVNWNYLLNKLKLANIGQQISNGTKINKLSYEHYFFEGVFEEEREKLNLPVVSSVFQTVRNNNALDLDLITLQNGIGLFTIAEQRGLSFMFYSSLHEKFGNITSDALFSAMVLRIGELSQRKKPYYLTLGDDGQYPIYNATDNDEAIHLIGKTIDLIPPTTTIAGVRYISVSSGDYFANLSAGNFQLKSNIDLGTISLNYSRDESDLNLLNENEIIQFLKASNDTQVTFNQIGADTQLSVVDINKPFGYWKICIILTLIFVFAEMLIIRLLK